MADRTVLGENISFYTEKNGDIHLVFSPTAPGRPSASGKTQVIASTHGAQKVGDLSVNLNVYRKA